MNIETVVFTVVKERYGLKIITRSEAADKEDRSVESVAIMLYAHMEELTKKYNEKGLAVLFEVE